MADWGGPWDKRESMNPLLRRLRRDKLLIGRGAVSNLLRACSAGRLVGGLSLSLGIEADEAVGPLLFAMGGAAKRFRVLDVSVKRPMVFEVSFGELSEKWQIDDVTGLVHNLNDLFLSEPTVRALVNLGEWDDALQLWGVSKGHLKALLPLGLDALALNGEVLKKMAMNGVRTSESGDDPH